MAAIDSPIARASIDFPVPGRSSKRMWPSQRIATSARRTTSSLPLMTVSTLLTTASNCYLKVVGSSALVRLAMDRDSSGELSRRAEWRRAVGCTLVQVRCAAPVPSFRSCEHAHMGQRPREDTARPMAYKNPLVDPMTSDAEPGADTRRAASAMESPEPENDARSRRWAHRYPPLLTLVVAGLIALLVLPSSLNLPNTNPSQTLEYAPVPPTATRHPPPNANLLAARARHQRRARCGRRQRHRAGKARRCSKARGANPSTKRCVGDPASADRGPAVAAVRRLLPGRQLRRHLPGRDRRGDPHRPLLRRERRRRQHQPRHREPADQHDGRPLR